MYFKCLICLFKLILSALILVLLIVATMLPTVSSLLRLKETDFAHFFFHSSVQNIIFIANKFHTDVYFLVNVLF